MTNEEIAALIEPVARHFWQEPNRTLSTKVELRWGTQGARAADLSAGVWSDYEKAHATINAGGVLDLVRRETGVASHAEAMQWLETNGFKQEEKRYHPGNGARWNGADRTASPEPEGVPPWDDENSFTQATPKAPRKIVAVYDYKDQSGALLYQVVRYEPKSFRQRQPAPGEPGVWVWGLSAGEYMRPVKGEDWRAFNAERFEALPKATRERMTLGRDVPICLYRLNEVRDAMEMEGALVFVVEGEKDTDVLWRLDVPATTVSGGAKKWRPEHADALIGAEIIVIPDNDKPGREHAEAVAKSLRGKAKSVKLLDLAAHWPAPEKGDVADYLAAGHSVERLYELAAVTPEYSPEPYRSKFRAVWFAGIDTDHAEPLEWLVDDLLTCGDRSMVYGKSKSGKSFAAIDLSMSIARGVPFLGIHKVKRGGVIYQAGEGTKGILNRFRAYARYHEVTGATKLPLAILRSPINLYSGEQDTDALIAECKALAEEMTDPLRLVVIDTLATATAGADENSARDMSPVLARVARVSDACRCHVMLVHHMNAAGERPRGHTGVFANIDNAIEVSVDEHTKIRTLKNSKQKDEQEAEPIQFELMRVVLGHRPDNREITSCVVLPLGEKAVARRAGFYLNDAERVFFRALLTALIEHGVPPAPALGLPHAIKSVVNYDKVKERYARLILADGDDPAEHKERLKKALQRARTSLAKFGVIGVDNPWIWWTGREVHGFGNDQAKLRGEPPPIDQPREPMEPIE